MPGSSVALASRSVSPIELPYTARERIAAPAATVFGLVAEVELWPAWFRLVERARLVGHRESRRLVELRTGGLSAPGRWRVVQLVDEAARHVSFALAEGSGKGSAITWSIVAVDGTDAACDVTVACRTRGGPFAVLGQRMLERVKEVAEGASLAGRA